MQRLLILSGFGLLGIFTRYGFNLGHAWLFERMPVQNHWLRLPWATIAANMIGSFLAGFIAAYWVDRGRVSEDLRIGLFVGFLGGFTTFSAYTLESVKLMQNATPWPAIAYAVGSPLLGISACMLGLYFGKL